MQPVSTLCRRVLIRATKYSNVLFRSSGKAADTVNRTLIATLRCRPRLPFLVERWPLAHAPYPQRNPAAFGRAGSPAQPLDRDYSSRFYFRRSLERAHATLSWPFSRPSATKSRNAHRLSTEYSWPFAIDASESMGRSQPLRSPFSYFEGGTTSLMATRVGSSSRQSRFQGSTGWAIFWACGLTRRARGS